MKENGRKWVSNEGEIVIVQKKGGEGEIREEKGGKRFEMEVEGEERGHDGGRGRRKRK